MRVQFKTNLGSTDAAKFGLNFKDCLGGESIEVSDKTGEALCRKGFAVDRTPPEKPRSLRTDPPTVEVAEAKPLQIETSEPAAESKGQKKPSK